MISLERIVLTDRLQAVANQVPQGARVVDVGTDHGYLP
ncbi:MAG: SAM-dependent methyltransferase, partial [Oscillospiraceae bacterium]